MKTQLPTPPEWRAPLAGYLAWLAVAHRPASTRRLRSYHLRKFANVTGLSPRLVTLDDLIAYIGSRTWSESTAHSVRSTMRSFFLWASVVARVVDENPAELLPSVEVTTGKPRPAGEHAIAGAMATADERVRFMLLLASTMGLRCCEIAKVHTGDVFEHPEDGWCLRIIGKGRRKRDVPLSPQVRLLLQSRDPGFVFPGRIDGHLSPGHVCRLISAALPIGVTAHMLRHRFASVAYKGAGNDIRAVQELLGHSSVSTTQIYTYVPSENRRAGVAAAAA